MTETLNDAATDSQQTIAELQRKLAECTAERDELLLQRTATADVLKVISRSAFDLESALASICETAARLSDADQAAIYRREGGLYHFAASFGFPQEYADAWRAAGPVPNDPKSPLVGHRAVAERRPVQVLDVTADPAFLASTSRGAQLRTALGIPLLREGQPVGNFVLGRRRVEAFTDRQIDLLQTFADKALIAIENTRLFNETKEALERQTATAEILKVIASSPSDVQPVFNALVLTARRLLGREMAGILLCGEDATFRAVAGAGPDGLIPIDPIFAAPTKIDPEANFPSRAIVSKKNLHLPDWSAIDLPEQERNMREMIGWNSTLYLPMLRGEECIGVLLLGGTQPGIFSESDIALAESFRDQAVIAIENARLFNETQEALERQTATSEVLQVISNSISNTTPVFERILESTERLITFEIAAIFLAMPDEQIHLAAFRGAQAAAMQGLYPRPLAQSLLPIMMATRRQICFEDAANGPDVPAFLRQIALATTKGNFSIAMTPLMWEGNAIGMLNVGRDPGVKFNERELSLLRTFADQAVIAIQNARLFEEVQAKTRELSQSLDDLRTAQDRLVQTEKLASLGQLTAGIAHEIKNPLNFVNNFSALSAELVDELVETLAPAPLDQKIRGDVGELTQLLKSNLGKVLQHGQRADSIVKNMLLHSREGSGEHRSADVNALVEESLNLAYHGARAEKSGFTVVLKRDLDPEAGAVELYPQEITRALLNLISNGFYAATQRKSVEGDTFEPVLIVATKNHGKTVEIRIRDNGTGIPDEVKEKIFNPFFTTKPSGEGTGLGLSMSHDIIVKQHGGSIDVETEPGHFTEFKIVLPRTNQR